MFKHARLAALFAACIVTPAVAQRGNYEDPTRGYKLRIPDKWTTVPVQIDEKWIVSKFLCNRSYETKSRDMTDSGEHKPFLQVIWFSDEARKLRVAEEKRGDTTYIAKNAPYRDYKDYLKRNLSEGYFFDKEEETTEQGVKCWKYQVKIDKSASMKRRLTTWMFRTDDGELAVEMEVLEDHYEKLEPMIMSALKSFRLIPKQVSDAAAVTGAGGSAVTELMWKNDRDQWRKLTVAERQTRRKQIEEQRMQKVLKDIPEGWTSKRTKHYLVISHGDSKFTSRLVDAAEAFRTWLEDQFDHVSDEYVMQGVIRVCADVDEARAYVKGSGDFESFNADNREVVTFQNKSSGNQGNVFGTLFTGMLDQYLYDKDPFLYEYLPLWLHWGLYDYVDTSVAKGTKLIFEPDQEDTNYVRELQRADKFLGLKEIMGKGAEDIDNRDDYRRYFVQGARWFRFTQGPGAKLPELKDFLNRCLKQTIVAAEEVDKTSKAKVSGDAETEAEEERRAKERKDYWKNRRNAVHDQILKSLNWSEQNWKDLEKAHLDILKKV